MVFGLFSRKREPVRDESSASQLRTPSPSGEPASIDKDRSPAREPPPTPSPPPETTKPTDLHALIQSIPPPTLHAYALAHLHPASSTLDPETLAHLSSFFAQLVPPPRLHCVRCHKDFFEVENNDRSCLVAHDDESAEVERVSAKAKGKNTLYETLWGCCGKTVEGDGDMGPPDGWCYEGKHTTDPKRARFRADSTMQDDKLISCASIHCHQPPGPTRKTRKRGRAVAEDEEVEDEDDEGNQSTTSSSHPSLLSASPRSSNGAKRRRTGTAKKSRRPVDNDDDRMDVDVPPSAPAEPTSPKAKPKSRAKPKFPTPTTAKMYTTPKASSPLVLVPPFVSHPASPEPPNKARVIISTKPKPAPAPAPLSGSVPVPGTAPAPAPEDSGAATTPRTPKTKEQEPQRPKSTGTSKTSPTTSPKIPSATASPKITGTSTAPPTTSPKASPKASPRARAASLKPPPLKSKPSAGAVSAPAAVGGAGGGTTMTPVAKSSVVEPPASVGRVRKNSSASSKSKSRAKGASGEEKEGKKTKGLGEVVDSSVDAERAQ